MLKITRAEELLLEELIELEEELEELRELLDDDELLELLDEEELDKELLLEVL